jgi:Trypsin-co-occurring domain 1
MVDRVHLYSSAAEFHFLWERSMTTLRKITLDDGSSIVVEVEDVHSDQEEKLLATLAKGKNVDLGLPESAEPVGAADKVLDTVKSLESTLRSVVKIIHESLKESSPNEWGVELSIGFKGTTTIIPVIVSGEANAAFKVNAKWVKPAEPKTK